MTIFKELLPRYNDNTNTIPNKAKEVHPFRSVRGKNCFFSRPSGY